MIYLKRYQKTHPMVQKKDLYRLLMLREFGDHNSFISLTELRKNYLEEYEHTTASLDNPLYEFISHNRIKVDLACYKEMNFDPDYLLRLHISFHKNISGSIDNYYHNSNMIELMIKSDYFDLSNMQDKGERYQIILEHSDIFTNQYGSAYRVIDSRDINNGFRLSKVKQFINKYINPHKLTVIALEGKCLVGKTTLSSVISSECNACILHVDDFFLPKDKYTRDVNKPAYNIDFDRIKKILNEVSANQIYKYQKYNCHKQIYEDAVLDVKNLIVLEGAFSYHPLIREYINHCILLYGDEKTREKRLLNRESTQSQEVYRTRWIPLENMYYDEEKLELICDVIV